MDIIHLLIQQYNAINSGIKTPIVCRPIQTHNKYIEWKPQGILRLFTRNNIYYIPTKYLINTSQDLYKPIKQNNYFTKIFYTY